MTKLNRRQFLKLTGAALVASAMPLAALGSLIKPVVPLPTINFGRHEAGIYEFSFYWKNNSKEDWTRYVKTVELKEEMEFTAEMPSPEGIIGNVQLFKLDGPADIARVSNDITYSNLTIEIADPYARVL